MITRDLMNPKDVREVRNQLKALLEPFGVQTFVVVGFSDEGTPVFAFADTVGDYLSMLKDAREAIDSVERRLSGGDTSDVMTFGVKAP